eukprot:g14284.t1
MSKSGSAALYYRRYDSTQHAIMEASTLGQQRVHEPTTSDDSGNQSPTINSPQLNGRSSGTMTHQQDENDPNQVPVAADTSANDAANGEPSDSGGGVGGGRGDDECLGLLAEAFADDLDLLRKDSTFTGSSKNIAAMADMMRCLANGMDSTEQAMLLENATR